MMDFVKGLTGTLISLREDEDTRFAFEIWFDYTRQAMNQIREGAMLSVANFASNGSEQHLSILEIVTILPIHYALGDERDTKGFPGFVVEAARNIVNDWEEQESESTEDTTKIRCVAIPTNMEIVQNVKSHSNQPVLGEESNLPMVGATVRVLDTEFTEYVANFGVTDKENTVFAGTLIRDPKVRIKVRVEDLLKTHFGVFGFTGAGKSNLLSTIVSEILSRSKEVTKIVFFDLMGEYTALLVDQLLREDITGRLICLGENTLPAPVFRYANKDTGTDLDAASLSFSRYTLLPKALKGHSGQMRRALGELLRKERVNVFSSVENMTLYYLFLDYKNNQSCPSNFKRRQTGNFQKRLELLKQFVSKHGGGNRSVTHELAETVLADLRISIEKGGELSEFAEDMGGVITLLEQSLPKLKQQLNCALSFPELIGILNNKEKPALLIVNSHDPNGLRSFAKQLGERMYEARRQSGEIEPLVSFIFDEADEFIPQQAEGSYSESSEIAMTLARRGRKFGLGIGIATQRVRYLNTSIMAQPHTYFVSKMPRATDREVVAQAFGISEEMFRQTFKFKKGDWLLMSYDATGLEALPLPTHCEDANTRIKTFLDSLEKGAKGGAAGAAI
jgi:hypothetical protein